MRATNRDTPPMADAGRLMHRRVLMVKRARGLTMLCVVGLLVGCAQPPAEQIQAAEQAVREAQQGGAGAYAADEYAKLEGNLAAIKKEVAEQDAKFALFRDYGKAEELAATTKAEAERVKLEAGRKMEDAKAAAIQAHQAAQEAVQRTLDLVATAPAGKDRAALESIKMDAQALKASLNDVQILIDKAEYLPAQTKAKAIQEKSKAVSQEIQAALTKIGKAKQGKSHKAR
jgi:hypothetical protein